MGLFDRIGAAFNALLGRQPAAAPEPDPGLPELGIPHVTGIQGGRIVATKNPDEVLRVLEEAAAEGRRASLKVHDANGWHDLYTNPAGAGRHRPDPGMSASELYKRLDRDGVPGTEKDQERINRDREERQPPPRPEPVAPPVQEPQRPPEAPTAEPERPSVGERVRGFFGGIGNRLGGLFGRGREESPAAPPAQESLRPEVPAGGVTPSPDTELTGGDEGAAGEDEEEDEFPDDFPDDWDGDVGDSEGDTEGDTEGYDVGSVNGYQVVIYY